MTSRSLQWLELFTVCLFACLVTCKPTGVTSQADESAPVVRMALDRSIRLRFECPPEHGDAFAVDYLPAVWLAVNSSVNQLKDRHSMAMCHFGDLTGANLVACLTVSGGHVQGNATASEASVYLIYLDLHSPVGQQPRSADRTAFHAEVTRLQASIKSLTGLDACANLNATYWARGDCIVDGDGSCPSPGDSSPSSTGGSEVAVIASVVVFVAFVGFIALATVMLVKRHRLKDQQQQQQQQQHQQQQQLQGCTNTSRSSNCEPQVLAGSNKLKQPSGTSDELELQPRRRTSANASASPAAAPPDASTRWIVGPPLPTAQRLSGIGWLNLAYNADDDDLTMKAEGAGEGDSAALPSRLTRFRAVGDVDEAEARRQFSRLGPPAGGDANAFYRVGDVSQSELGLAFVLANSRLQDDERLLELIWACDGVAVSLDASFVANLEHRSASSSRFYLTGWERTSFPCHSMATATMHCLDTNLSKRIRVCEFVGQLSPDADVDDSPASLSEFVHFAHACADQHLALSAAPAAAVGREHSSASLLPLLLLAARRTRLSEAPGGGAASCDLLRLAAGLRRQCPLAVATEAHYLFVMRCLHAYACALKRNSM